MSDVTATGFTAGIEELGEASFYPNGVHPGMPAVALRHPGGPWTTAPYSSIEAMSRLPVFAEFVIDGVRIVLAETTTKGSTTSRNGVEVWTKPAMAYASTVRLFESSHSRLGGDVFYILPHPDNEKPSNTISAGIALGEGTAGRDAVLTPRGVEDQWRTGAAVGETKLSRIGHFMTVWTGERKRRGEYKGAPKWKHFIPSLHFPATRDECKAAWLKIKGQVAGRWK